MADEPGATPYAMQADYAGLAPPAREVLDCWFGAPGTPGFGDERKLWFSGDVAFDAMLRERFGELIDVANDTTINATNHTTNNATNSTTNDATAAAALDHWQATPLGALALIIVLDQFSRNCHRNTPRAFAADQKALRAAQRMIASGADRLLPSAHHRAFAYLPFEHDETLASQRESLRLFKQLQTEPGGESYYGFAVRHAEIIERFGRFPHRNAVLGRSSTAEEIAFLRKPGSSFQAPR
ncbi:conserved hypothetical protein [Paraburkholderia ribeironis]|uniref:Transmembrane protein n=1 Tax=Paraburkholderia ribeironis TaxID=1247936 RepID=A0A1N7S0K7_9BURK|nr:DUF924 family protein [Paraburkholderia ribeironis]SIT40912.1 conserved hypothetical protein [Paraburkholderia ribeironis]